MTKKTLSILLAGLLVLSALFALVACTPSVSEVKLLGISGSQNAKTKTALSISSDKMFASLSAPVFADADTDDPTDPELPATEPEPEPEPEPEIPEESDIEFKPFSKLIYRSQKVFFLTITLDNPNNHYIMDFRLNSEGSEIKILQGTTWSDMNAPDTYIRWDEAYDRVGNKTATFKILLCSPEVTPDRITISEMYYSSRVDGANKTAVNMDGKETFTIYKIDGPMEMYDRVNSFDEFTFKLNTNGVEIIKVALDGETITADESGVYHVLHDGELKITYQYLMGDDNTPEQITSTEQIELLKFIPSKTPEPWLTDFEGYQYPICFCRPFYKQEFYLGLNGYFTGTDVEYGGWGSSAPFICLEVPDGSRYGFGYWEGSTILDEGPSISAEVRKFTVEVDEWSNIKDSSEYKEWLKKSYIVVTGTKIPLYDFLLTFNRPILNGCMDPVLNKDIR